MYLETKLYRLPGHILIVQLMLPFALTQAKRRLAALAAEHGALPAWRGHVHRAGATLLQDSQHRPMDLRAVPAAGGAPRGGDLEPVAVAASEPPAAGAGRVAGWEALLRVGSVIAAEARAAVRAEAGYRTSAGVACNKMLAKLVRWGPPSSSLTACCRSMPPLRCTKRSFCSIPSLSVRSAIQLWCESAALQQGRAAFAPLQRAAQAGRPDGAAAA